MPETVEERVEKLEKQLLTFKVGAVVFAVCLTAFAYIRVDEIPQKIDAYYDGEIGSAAFQNSLNNITSVKWEGDVLIARLQAFNKKCDQPNKSQTDVCASAMHQFCLNEKDAKAGISQEVSSTHIHVVCLK